MGGGGIEPAATRGVCLSMSIYHLNYLPRKHVLFSENVIIYTYQLLSGDYDYQYQLGQNAAQNSTPRGATIPEHAAVLPAPSTSHSLEYHDNQDYDYQQGSQTFNEVDDLSEGFAATSLNDEQLPSTTSASHVGYQSSERQQGKLFLETIIENLVVIC